MQTLLTLGKDEINALSDGIVLIDEKGGITGINRVPAPMLKRVLENRHAISAWVSDAVSGTLPLPAAVEFQDAGTTAAADEAGVPKASLCRNGRRGYALVIRQDAGGVKAAAGADAIPLMGQEILDQLRATEKLLRRFEPTGSGAATLIKQSNHLADLLRDIAALAELRGRDALFSEERFQLASVLRDLLPRLPRQGGADAIRYEIDAGAGDLGYVYGNRQWLQQALHTLLLRLAAGCAPCGQVRIELRQIGDFVIMKGATHSQFPAAIPLLPLTQTTESASALNEGGLAMDICRRIIDLHGGQIRLNPLAGGMDEGFVPAPIESFTLALPTGLPVADRSRVSCAECRITFQALQYARDLAGITEQAAAPRLKTHP